MDVYTRSSDSNYIERRLFVRKISRESSPDKDPARNIEKDSTCADASSPRGCEGKLFSGGAVFWGKQCSGESRVLIEAMF
jgi:hypothetical protein